ncbi:MAG: hypothetical protein ACKO22_08330 [Cyanobium sp.]
MHPGGFQRGTADFARAYGMLIEALEMAYPQGFACKQVTPVAEAEVPARLKRAQEVFATSFWRQQLAEWTTTVKPAAIAAHRAIQANDPGGLNDDDSAAACSPTRRSWPASTASRGWWAPARPRR